MSVEKLLQTGSQTVGPFFHDGLFLGDENVLVTEESTGEHILITGTVYDGDGVPVPDAMVEIWQPDAQGFFNHPADPNQAQADPTFRGFGRADTTDNGNFLFQTVKPGSIPDAISDADGAQYAPSINIRVFARGMLIHAVTRLYFADESMTNTDPVLSTLDPARRQTLIASPIESDDLPCYHFDIHLQGEAETVFFNP